MNLTPEELKSVQDASMDLSRLKMKLGDIEMARHKTLKEVDKVIEGLMKTERKLASKYGNDAVFNMTTGELTKK